MKRWVILPSGERGFVVALTPSGNLIVEYRNRYGRLVAVAINPRNVRDVHTNA